MPRHDRHLILATKSRCLGPKRPKQALEPPVQAYSIRVPVDAISLNDGCHHSGSVFAVPNDSHDLVQCPRILLQCDAQGAVLQSYQLAGHWTGLRSSDFTM
jgi:hypothetical protein